MAAFQRRGDDLKELEILSAPQSHAQKLFIRITVEKYQVRKAFTPRKHIASRSGFGGRLNVGTSFTELGNKKLRDLG